MPLFDQAEARSSLRAKRSNPEPPPLPTIAGLLRRRSPSKDGRLSTPYVAISAKAREGLLSLVKRSVVGRFRKVRKKYLARLSRLPSPEHKDLEPRLIVTLGIAPAWFVAPLIGPCWRCGLVKSPAMLRSSDIDVEPAQTPDGVIFVAATHPSHANNSRLRTFTVDGDETQLLARARTMAGISGA
jgi:hypothetical protein